MPEKERGKISVSPITITPLFKGLTRMPAQSNYSRGRDTEYLARNLLVLHGYQVVRSAGSHTPIDLVAWQDGGHPLLIQVKRNSRHLDRTLLVEREYANVIRSLREMPRPIKADVELWVWAPLKGWHFYSVLTDGISEVLDHGM